jgi:hypothetical protein
MKKTLFLLLLATTSLLFSQGSLPDCYPTNQEIIDQLNQYQEDYPDICQVEVAGYSQQDNMPIYMIKLSNDVEEFHPEKPVILFSNVIHAEEVLGIPIALKTLDEIITNRNRPPYLNWLQQLQIYVIPVLNVEGYEVVRSGLDTSYRKNKRDNNENGVFDFNPVVGYDVDGTDNNRNFPFNWVHGDTLYTTSGLEVYDYFRGSAPLSETETNVIWDFVEEYKPVYSIQWHSSRTGNLSEKVYFPWNWYGIRPSPDLDMATQLAEGVASQMLKDDQSSTYEYYPGMGRKGSQDHSLYQAFGTIQLLIECGTLNLQPDQEGMDFVAEQGYKGQAWMMNRALSSSINTASNSMLTGVVTDAVTGQPLEAEIEIDGRNPRYFKPRLTLAESGRYFRPLVNGQYTLIVKKDGYYTQTQNVTVYNMRTTKDVQLVPLPELNTTLTLNVEGFWGEGSVKFEYLDIADHEEMVEGITDGNPEVISLLAGDVKLTFESEDRYFSEEFTISAGSDVINIDLSNFQELFTDDFSNLDNWTGTDNWAITNYTNLEGVEQSFVSDSKYWNFNFDLGFDNNFYEPNCDYSLTNSEPITINPANTNYIELEHWLHTDWDHDYATVYISDNGVDWLETPVWSESGQFDYLHKDWIKIPADFQSESLYITLSLTDDGSDPGLIDPGWNINSISVKSFSPVVTANDNDLVPAVNSKLGNNYPNPFNPETSISFSLDTKSAKNATIDIFNLRGQKVKRISLSDKEIKSGKVVWNAEDNASGIYLYRLTSDGIVIDTKKATLLK